LKFTNIFTAWAVPFNALWPADFGFFRGRWLALASIKKYAVLLALCTQLAPALADTYVLPSADDSVVGWAGEVQARHEDTLADIAREFQVGHTEMRLANPGIDFWLPGAGTLVRIPTRYVLPNADRKGIVLNVPEMRLYYFPEEQHFGDPVVVTYPVSIGRMDWSTPLGITWVTAKVKNPSWTPPQSILEEAAEAGEPLPTFIPPGPDNPLGEHALRLGLPSYLIHGTNRPYGVGMRVTHGCVRMYPEDIERLFSEVAVGTPVNIVNQPIKLGWLRDTLFIEVHPPLEEDTASRGELQRIALELINQADSERPVELLGRNLQRALREQSGMPVAISRGTEM
jgi:L,D-transpeptidase ErfK/SrfK